MKDFIDIIKDITNNYPDRISVIDNDLKITYVDIFKLVTVVSNHLHRLKVKPRVVIDMKQGIEAYVIIIAVMNVCGTYCPLNPYSPLARKKQIINDFAPNIIICNKNDFKEFFHDYIIMTYNELLIDPDYSENSLTPLPDDIIYVIYTSGSTGQSKGVNISRKSLNKFLEWSIPIFGAGEKDIWGQYSFLSFDLSIVDIFTSLCSGATLYSMNKLSTRKYRPSKIIEQEKITIWHSVPSAIDAMMATEATKEFDFSSIRVMSFCGEPLKKLHVEFLFSKNKEMIIFNTYGPTEGTLFCTYQVLTYQNYTEFCHYDMSIGKVIPGWNIFLKDLENTSEKEIIIYGDYIGSGYLGDIQNSKFNKFSINGKSFNSFESGDLAITINNNLYFSQRIDRQIKIKGYRIELNEIEFRIYEFTKTNNTVVYKNSCLYAFIESNEMIDLNGLKVYLNNTLEEYKLPNDYIVLKNLPRNLNQKIDIQALLQIIP